MIVLSNAHHRRFPGAENKSIKMNEYWYSCEINRRISNLIELDPESDEEIFILDQSWKGSYNEHLREKVRIINSLRPDVAIENHLNAAESNEAQGCETLYYPTSIRGQKLATMIQNQVMTIREIKVDRGIKPRDNVLFLRGTTCTSVITEPLFISNQSAILLLDEKFLDKLAKSIFGGIKEYLESERNG